ncbi:response regulator [Methylobacterium sp. J-043]|jgi:DNA-binding response OmpR family regulator|uniref:response regulator n=1 Tax=Methylorubrum TaxID=2282523 RepID=UPI0020A05327|nr:MULTISPECIES: response regulator [Methylorubrum]MCJ2031790.1 response regulator [Methylobacterium sp. J-043]MCP1547407.1 DNA-binding response OmpR family regulator [Methylorubrum zatmanii]MCP1555977.1 DNA-binding response OmpR family regulator [Methylorubrum extorquens]MCP1577710.1 DNA-binding response OmpR family regulator [Methylorubrum extorquens]
MPDLAQPLAGRFILVVEDEYLIAMHLKRWLEEAGATVIGPVPSVDRALDLIEDVTLDAAVLDVNLGDGDTVYPVAETLTGIAVPYLFATGQTERSHANNRWEQPSLAKPFSKDELLRTLTGLMTSPRQSS